MDSNYFSGCTTTAELKTQYRKLAFQYHPDRNPGDDTCTAKMKEINALYDTLVAQAQRQERPRKPDETQERADSRYAYYEQGDTLVREKIMAIVHLEGLEIEICGWWIWVGGNTREHKEVLKAAGYRWSGQKARWYFAGVKSHGRGTYDMDDIREAYGSERVETRRRSYLAN